MYLISKNILHLLFFILTIIYVTLFQNCSASKMNLEERTESLDSLKAFFNYSYSQRPQVYVNLAIIFLNSEVDGVFKYKFIGMLTSADGNFVPLAYSVHITDSNDQPLCAGSSGLLPKNLQVVEFECVGRNPSPVAYVKFSTSLNGKQEVFKSVFYR